MKKGPRYITNTTASISNSYTIQYTQNMRYSLGIPIHDDKLQAIIRRKLNEIKLNIPI